MKSPRAKKAVAALALLTLAAAAWSFARAKSEEQVNRARFAADGSVHVRSNGGSGSTWVPDTNPSV